MYHFMHCTSHYNFYRIATILCAQTFSFFSKDQLDPPLPFAVIQYPVAFIFIRPLDEIDFHSVVHFLPGRTPPPPHTLYQQ